MGPAGTSWRARWALAALVAGYLAIDLLSSTPGSPLRPPLPPGVAVPGALARASTWAGMDRLGHVGASVAALVLLGVLVASFVVLMVEAFRGRVRLRAVVAAGALSLALAAVAPVVLSRDVYSYAAYGRIVSLHGASPYVEVPTAFPRDPFVAVLSPEWRTARSVYGPAFTLLSTTVSGASPAAVLLAFKVIAAVAAAGSAWLAGAAAVRWGRPDLP